MAETDETRDDEETTDVAVQDPAAEGADDDDQALDLKVDIEKPSACERHVSVTVSRADIDRYLDDAYSAMMPNAAVPGFRAGRAPRKLVEQRFKTEVVEQVKGSLLMDSLTQISEEGSFAAISEPDLNLEAVELPEDGPLTFEFDIEVRPDFDLPKWKGLQLKQPTHEFTDEDIDTNLKQTLGRYGQLVPHDGAAAEDDYLTANITAKADGEVVSEDEELVIRVRETLSFTDAKLEGFGKLMTGAKAGDKKTATVTIGPNAPNEELRGKDVELEFEILEIKKLKLPELTEDFLKEIGSFDSEEALRDAVKQNLERQLEYAQQQQARGQITELLTESANWELPPGLLKRQSARELERAVMELRRSGFSESEIRARENTLRQNSGESTATALKEHFILERIAEEEGIDVEDGDFEKEIFLMSMQSGESPRRVRAQLEKRGLMDVLRNQIVERKVMEAVQAEAKFTEEPYEPAKDDTEAVPLAVGGRGADIPEAVEKQEEEAAAEE